MWISQNPKFLFVHIQKTGGTSLAKLLRQKLPGIQSFLGTHDHAARARDALGDTFTSYFKFAFVRNPWERLVSWYTMIRERSAATGSGEMNRFWQYVMEHGETFDDFVYRCTDVIEDIDGVKCAAYNQLDYVSDKQGDVIVDFIGRYETLASDADQVLRRLGLSHLALPHENRSNHRDYRHYYSDATKRVVAERYARDIEHFGYRF